MFTTRSRQNKRKYILGICVIIFIYLLLFARYQTFEYQEVIKNAKAKDVWEFVADFNQMKKLNPTILEFKIVSDHGNNEDWKYTVEYIENMLYWPYWKSQATGAYHIRKVKQLPVVMGQISELFPIQGHPRTEVRLSSRVKPQNLLLWGFLL